MFGVSKYNVIGIVSGTTAASFLQWNDAKVILNSTVLPVLRQL
jgi:hypothetical protein